MQRAFETHDEKPTNSFLYSLVMDTYSMGFASGSVNEMPLNHKIFLAQFDAIKDCGGRTVCLVGRCADYALEERDDVLSVFIHADLEDRIKNVAKLNELTDNKAKDLIHKTDKRRASYYNYYTNKKWGDAESYDICINSSKFGVDGCVKAIKDFLELEASWKTKNSDYNVIRRGNKNPSFFRPVAKYLCSDNFGTQAL